MCEGSSRTGAAAAGTFGRDGVQARRGVRREPEYLVSARAPPRATLEFGVNFAGVCAGSGSTSGNGEV